MAYGVLLEAEYLSGYVHKEDERDISPYVPGRNIFYDIVNELPTKAGHGPMVRWSMRVDDGEQWDIDWTKVPTDARPIYFRDMERSFDQEAGWGPAICKRHVFGFEHENADGVTQQDLREV